MVIGVVREAREKGVKIIAFVGDIADGEEGAYKEGVRAVFSIKHITLPYKEKRLGMKKDLALVNLLRFQKTLPSKLFSEKQDFLPDGEMYCHPDITTGQ